MTEDLGDEHLRNCIIGHFHGPPDEGMRNTTLQLFTRISKHHEVIGLDIKDLIDVREIMSVRRFHPDVVHFLLGPSSILSFAVTKNVSLLTRNAKVVMSALQLGPLRFRWLVRVLKPDLVLTQSYFAESFFVALGCRVRFLPSGVDTKKFLPVSEKTKRVLRQKYCIPPDKFVILHVGPIKKGRNIQLLGDLQVDQNQVLLVGRRSGKLDQKLLGHLRNLKCIVWPHLIDRIEEVYQLSDCYLFPVVDKYSCIEIPLSIMEAMSCNLPVITTEIGAIPRLFEEGDGLMYVKEGKDFLTVLEAMKGTKRTESRTRKKVSAFDWENIANMLGKIYKEILRDS